ncbi:MAG TPA: extracellular solute-binding protein [Tissierellaceae bacterium]
MIDRKGRMSITLYIENVLIYGREVNEKREIKGGIKMNRYLKLIGISLIIILLVTSFLGCAKKPASDVSEKNNQTQEPNGEQQTSEEVKKEEPPKEEEPDYDFGGRVIRSVAYWNRKPEEGASEIGDKLLARVAELEKKWNFKFEWIEVPHGEYVETLTASTLAGDPVAELAYIWSHYFLPGFVTSGIAYPVSDLGVFDFSESKWDPSKVEVGTFAGKQYNVEAGRGWPRSIVIWNKTLFEREGLPNLYELEKNGEWTWEKLLEIAKQATKDLDGDGQIDQWGITGSQIVYNFIYSNGAEVVRKTADGIEFALNDPKAYEALEFYQKVNAANVIRPWMEGDNWDTYATTFRDGQVAMCIAEFWVVDSYLSDGKMKDEYGIIYFPKGPQATEYVSYGYEETIDIMLGTVKNPKDVAIIWDAITDVYLEEETPGYWRDFFEQKVNDTESMQVIETILNKGLNKINLHRGFPDLVGVLDGAIGEITSGTKTPQAAIEAIEQQAKKIIEDALKGGSSQNSN